MYLLFVVIVVSTIQGPEKPTIKIIVVKLNFIFRISPPFRVLRKSEKKNNNKSWSQTGTGAEYTFIPALN